MIRVVYILYIEIDDMPSHEYAMNNDAQAVIQNKKNLITNLFYQYNLYIFVIPYNHKRQLFLQNTP